MLTTYVIQELKLQIKSLPFLLVCLATIAVAYLLTSTQMMHNDVANWGYLEVSKKLFTLGLFMPVIVAIFAVKACLRDTLFNMQELVFTASISTRHLVWSRFLGVVFASIILLLIFVAAYVLSLVFLSEQAINYQVLFMALLSTSLLFILPAILLAASIFCALATTFQSSLAIYLLAGASVLVYQLLLVFTGSPLMANPSSISPFFNQMFNWADPLASGVFFQQTKYWTVEQRNFGSISMNNEFIVNRVVTILFMLSSLALSLFTFHRRVGTENNKKLPADKPAAKQSNSDITLPEVPAHFNSTQQWQAFFSLLKLEYKTTIKTKLFAILSLFWLVVVGTEAMTGLTYIESLGVTPIATTSLAINRFAFDVIPNFGVLFLVLFSAEVMWRERSLDIASSVDSSPVHNWQLFFAKLSALIAVPLTFITLAILVSASLQLLYAGPIDWLTYLSLYVICGLPLLFWACLFTFIHSICSSKVIAIVISILLVLITHTSLGESLGLEHGLLKFAYSPINTHSAMTDYSQQLDAFIGYMAVWFSVSLLLVLFGFALLRRGVDINLITRIRQMSSSLTTKGKLATAVAVILTITSSGSVYYHTNVVGLYQSYNDKLNWRLGYEHKYQQYRGMPTPTVVKAKNKVAIYPDQRMLAINTNLTLQNNHKTNLNTLLISVSTMAKYKNMHLQGAELIEFDSNFNQYLFKFNVPMKPNEQRQLSFDLTKHQTGYMASQQDSFITNNFVYFRDLRYMPFLGYSKHNQLNNDQLREQHGLAPLATPLTLSEDIAKHQGDFSKHYSWANVETIISTKQSHLAIAPGELVNQWLENNRRFFHYQTKHPIRYVVGIVSGELTKSVRQTNSVSIEVYHTPSQKLHAQQHLQAMVDTINYGNQHFGRYNAKQLRLVATPSTVGLSGYALPQLMFIDEERGFLTDLSNEYAFDHLYRRTTHEVAHQWWGHGVNGASTEGETMLVETLAVYTQDQLLKQKYGAAYVNRLLEYEHDRYFNGRGRSAEQELPLYRGDENHLMYSKGNIAMNALAEKLGTEVVNQALAQLVNNHSYPEKPATTLDFIGYLKHLADDEGDSFVEQQLQQVVINDWQIESVKSTEVKQGFHTEVCLNNLGFELDKQGNKQNVPELAHVQLVLLNEHPSQVFDLEQTSDPMATNTISSTSARCYILNTKNKPNFAAIDPYYLSLDINRANNIVAIQ